MSDLQWRTPVAGFHYRMWIDALHSRDVGRWPSFSPWTFESLDEEIVTIVTDARFLVMVPDYFGHPELQITGDLGRTIGSLLEDRGGERWSFALENLRDSVRKPHRGRCKRCGTSRELHLNPPFCRECYGVGGVVFPVPEPRDRLAAGRQVFDPGILRHILEFAPGDRVQMALGSELDPIVLIGEGWTGILMPLRHSAGLEPNQLIPEEVIHG